MSSSFPEASIDMVDNRRKSRDELFEKLFGREDKIIEHEETGTQEEQSAFLTELEYFFREKGMDFKPPKLYGKIINCLKLYRAVIRLGGYYEVTRGSLWRQIGISHKYLPEACNLPSKLRIFYEKVLLEYERHSHPQLALPSVHPPVVVNVNTSACRPRRDAATRAMQGWNAPHRYGDDEIVEPIIKNKSLNLKKCEQKFKSTDVAFDRGSVENKRPEEMDHPIKAAPTETYKKLVTTVVDVGTRCDWVKINVLDNRDCFEVYALVPGFSCEEVKIQVDPKGRLIIIGQPKDQDNPWGITAFQKVISFPVRIDPAQISTLVTLHGQLFVSIPIDK